MAKENYSNFATTTLATASINSSALTFAVSAGQGTLFPLTNFMVTMDTEIMFIASRSVDTFTVGIRGFDSSIATSHTSGATIQQCVTAYTMNHLWQNIADSYNPDIPPIQLGNTPSTYDAEFETGGNPLWSLYPSSGLPSGATFSFGTPLKSCLLLNRGPSDNTYYTAYVPFTMLPPFTATCKVSHAAPTSNSTSGASVNFFIADQTNPTGSADGGNRIRATHIIENFTQTNNLWDGSPILSNDVAHTHMLKDVSGVGTFIGPSIPVSPGMPIYLRITCSASNQYTCFAGDGITFWKMGTQTSSFTKQSLGIAFYANPQATSTVLQTAVVDWIRVTPFTTDGTFGS